MSNQKQVGSMRTKLAEMVQSKHSSLNHSSHSYASFLLQGDIILNGIKADHEWATLLGTLLISRWPDWEVVLENPTTHSRAMRTVYRKTLSADNIELTDLEEHLLFNYYKLSNQYTGDPMSHFDFRNEREVLTKPLPTHLEIQDNSSD